MTIHVISSDTTTQINAQTTEDTWLVQKGVYVTTSSTAIWSRGSTTEKTFYVDGTVIAESFSGISLGAGDGSGGDNKVTVGETGSIHGGEGISSDDGQLTVTNYGTVTGGNGVSDNVSSTSGEAIEAFGGRNTVINDGTIASVSQSAPAILLGGTGNYVENSGTIRTRSDQFFDAAVDFGTSTNGSTANYLVNTGLISGSNAIRGNDGLTETITNAGKIVGSVFLSGGNDTLTNHGLMERGSVNAGSGADTIINRGEIAGTIRLGSDNDLFVAGASAEHANGGSGIDTIDYRMSQQAVDLRLWSGYAEGGDASGDTVVGFENAIGGAAGDLLVGTGRANELTGLGGDDTLRAGSGDDTLRGGAGADRLIGGLDADTAAYDTSAVGVTVRLRDGFADGGDATGDTLLGIENLIGSDFADTLAGDGVANVLTGGAGDDLLRGNGGGDTLEGGIGTDTVSYAEAARGSLVTLDNASANWGAAKGDSFKSIENLTGSQYNDTLVGDAGANVLAGLGGADDLRGGGGRDTASYAAADSGAVVTLDNASANWGAAKGDSFQSIENLTGSARDDTLVGLATSNTIRGGDGADKLRAGAGNDVLQGGLGADRLTGGADDDTFVFAPGTGADTIQDWQAGSDQLDLSAFGYGSFAEVDNDARQVGSDLLIGFGGDDSVRILGLAQADFDSGDVVI